jgi:hypothetical protein
MVNLVDQTKQWLFAIHIRPYGALGIVPLIDTALGLLYNGVKQPPAQAAADVGC